MLLLIGRVENHHQPRRPEHLRSLALICGSKAVVGFILHDWRAISESLGTFSCGTGGTLSITDTPGAQIRRFYRAVRTP